MANQIFINLPVKDLNKSVAFFTKLGYNFNPQFTNEKATCMIISETIYVMLLTEAFFSTFTHKSISDATTSTEVILSLPVDSKKQVDEIIYKAKEAGATTLKEPVDLGWMYQQTYQDPDGHLWEIFHMDMQAMAEAGATSTPQSPE